eukprot:XP_015139422.1 sushi domain-containing protein 4 [Gallus gallus]
MGRSVGRRPVLPCPEDTVVTPGGERGNAPSSALCRWRQETATAAVAMRQRLTHCCVAVNFRPTRSSRVPLPSGRPLRDPLGVGAPRQPCVRAAAVPPGPAAPGSLEPGRCALRLPAAPRAGRAEPRARVPARVRGAARLRAAEPQRRRGPGGRRGAADGAAGSGGGGGGAPRSRRAAPGGGEAAARRGSLVAGGGGGGAPDARGGQKMCHGKQASGGGALPAARRRALAAALWLRLALSLGPGPAAGGFDDLHACADPGAPEHGYKTPSAGVFFESVVVRFHCQEGYRLNGTSKKLCVRHFNGSLSWKPSDKPVCLQEVTDCLVPHVEDAEIHNKTYRTGDKLIISCHEGFQIRYPDLDNMVSVCQDDGTWDNLPICQGCLRPLVLPHSYINISEFESSFSVGTVVYYQCFPGYKLEGAEFLECMYNLIWSDSPPRCLDVEVCPLPPMVSHGDYICHPRPCERYNHGTVVEFYCDPGYTLTNDYKYITCQYGEWFPSYQVYCVKTEQTWPNTQETLLTTWKIVAFTATSVLLVLLLVILARMFQTKFKTHFLPRGNQEGSMGDPDFVVVDGVPVMLPSYDEAVSSSLNALAPGYSATVDQGHILQTEDQSPPAYPGPRITDMLPSEFESCESQSGSSELLQSLYSPPACQAAVRASSDRTDASRSTAGEAVSTSPRIDITDEIPLMEEDP